MEVFQLGSFQIRLDWVYLIITIALGMTATKLYLKKKAPSDLQYLDFFGNAIFLAFILWKLSPIFTQLDLLINPFVLLVTPGTPNGLSIGILGAVIYGAWTIKKKQLPWRRVMDALLFGSVCAIFLYSITHWRYGTQTAMPWGISLSDSAYRYHPVNVYQALLMGIVIGRAYSKPYGMGKVAYTGFLGIGISTLAITLYMPKLASWYGLTAPQWYAIISLGIGLFIYFIVNLKGGQVHESRAV
ncbi:hypothetical protein B1A99_24565 [Cohnella sp. CIP 111063]|uniref:hypothetical protein n=1 Tax=unclassified Cohnella TaxID=2636738 RepID=UPI000B8C143B|nr:MULTISPECIES: hypothetical protein [unclassified Cohnella]OXS54957.1 hypothetical protein B1A99_24565 [Cohnella sp. CIP 111063]PRX65100.1 prolipoprotein diacylglyceryltransferase [Cohnella sp. SGD-V74]